jgi:predicted nuclease with RNAse H fold
MGDVLGLHLLQSLDLIGTPRRSAVARVDAGGDLVALDLAADDDEVIALVAAAPGLPLAVDAPLEVPNATGRRDLETVLAWCDIPAFPVSGRRLAQVFGGARGTALAPALAGLADPVLEALPDQVLRQIAWERDHPAGTPAMDLADYRAAWLAVRPPPYRPKGLGRARPEGVRAAWGLLAGVLDLGGWTPAAAPDDWAAIADAARIDALCCAYAALRLGRPGEHAVVGAPGHGRAVVPADANLRGRIDLTLERLRSERSIAI